MTEDLNLLTKKTGQVTYGIDASSANKGRRTGVENYARHLIQAMKQQALDGGERVFLYAPSILDDQLDAQPTGWETKILKWPFSKGWMSGRVSWEMLRRTPNLLFVPAQAPPKIATKNFVTTIHDIGFIRHPDLYDPKTRKRLKSVTKRAIKKSKRLLVPSEFTKQELMSAYRVPAEEIVVTPLSANTDIFRPMSEVEYRSTLQRHRLSTNFFLFVGRLEKKKNVTTLIRAFELFKEGRGLGDPFELVLVGDPGFGKEELNKFIGLSKQKEHIKLLGYRTEEEVAALMNAAFAYVFPSWYEGFGIPNLEAMACNTPLITSNIPAHKEVCADAAIFVSPKEPESWAHAMSQIVRDGTMREQLVEKGKLRAQEFSWEKTAQQTWELLRSLV